MGKLLSVLFPNDAATYSHKAQNFGTETSTTKYIISYVKVKCLRLWTYEVINGHMAILCTLSLKNKQLFLSVACCHTPHYAYSPMTLHSGICCLRDYTVKAFN